MLPGQKDSSPKEGPGLGKTRHLSNGLQKTLFSNNSVRKGYSTPKRGGGDRC